MAVINEFLRIYIGNGILSVVISFTSNYFVLYSVTRFMRGEASVTRLVLASAILTSEEMLSRAIDPVHRYPFVASVTIIALLVIKEDYDVKELLGALVAYVTVSATLYAVEGITRSVFEDESVSSFVTIGGLLAVSVMYRAVFALAKGKCKKSNIVGVELRFGGRKVKVKGYLDSGNALYEDGKPVSVISQRTAKRLGVVSCGEIAVSTVTGIRLLPSANVEIKLFSDKNSVKSYNAPVVISDRMVSRGYDVLLNRDMEVV